VKYLYEMLRKATERFDLVWEEVSTFPLKEEYPEIYDSLCFTTELGEFKLEVGSFSKLSSYDWRKPFSLRGWLMGESRDVRISSVERLFYFLVLDEGGELYREVWDSPRLEELHLTVRDSVNTSGEHIKMLKAIERALE
jgi:hypothetical protein